MRGNIISLVSATGPRAVPSDMADNQRWGPQSLQAMEQSHLRNMGDLLQDVQPS